MKRKSVAASDSFWGDLANALALRPVYRQSRKETPASASTSSLWKRQKQLEPAQTEAMPTRQRKPDLPTSTTITDPAQPASKEQNIDDDLAAALELLQRALARRGRARPIDGVEPNPHLGPVKVEKRILVNVPVSTAYNQWTQFEDFPHFMGRVESVTQLSDDRLEWMVEIGGVRRQWEAKILEQVPDRKVAWAATEGATNAGAVEFEDVGGGQTSLQLTLEYEPEGLIEKISDELNVVDRQAENDLQRFKEFIEDEGYASGAWRSAVNPGTTVGTPVVKYAGSSRGDSRRAGVASKIPEGLRVAPGSGAAAGTDKGTTGAADKTTKRTLPGEPITVAGTTTTGSVAAADNTASVADLGDSRVGHPFDQTYGLVDTTGEADETLEGENLSPAERESDERRPDGGLPPIEGSRGTR